MTAADFKGLTWAVGSVRGVRAFGVDPLGRLHGVTYKQVWRPGENVANCRGNEADHSLLNCACGFYAYNASSSDYETGDRIAAVVEGYGKTVLTEKGFRASKARIVALYDPTAAVDVETDPDGWRRGKPQHWAWFWGAVSLLIIAAAIGFTLAVDWGWWELAISGPSGAIAGHLFTSNVREIDRTRRLSLPSRHLRSYHQRAKAKWLEDNPRQQKSSVSPELVAKVRRNYPGVPWYTDRDQMLADFPPDIGPEPSPDTMPDFWDKPVKEDDAFTSTNARIQHYINTFNSSLPITYYGGIK